VIHNNKIIYSLIEAISVTTTEMFRDPNVFKYLRDEIVPYLKTFPHIRIWHAGIGTGEEIYSLSIILKEENILDRCTIYATDINENMILKVKKGIFPIKKMKDYTQNYQKSGGKKSLSDYYLANYNNVIFDQKLIQNITFAQHNLATDSVFVECNLILCRNVMIYFNSDLQNRVIKLFHSSLTNSGVLTLGLNETLQLSPYSKKFSAISDELKIYRKVFNE
jgi:chemotaxis protein methyltransferase CheR